MPLFHIEIYETLENATSGIIEEIAFRGASKSVITSLAFVLWSALTDRRKFIIVISDTFDQAKMLLSHIQTELEDNKLLREDYGDMHGADEWQAVNMVLKNNVRIVAKSRGQKVRGLRHNESRPDLIIGDDIENIEDVRTREQRDKTEEWFLSDVIPATDPASGLIVIVGSILHHDSLMSRMKNKILNERLGRVFQYPLHTASGRNRWAHRFTQEIIDRIKGMLGSRYYLREYELLLTSADDQIVKSIEYYDTLPPLRSLAIGVDLAISQEDTADYTAVCAVGEGVDGNFYVVGLQYARWSFNDTMLHVHNFFQALRVNYPHITPKLGIEDVAYQKAAIEEFKRRYSLSVTPIKHGGQDKRARLETLSPYFENKQVFFPRKGAENLVDQLIGFGVEAHDDCVDSFEMGMRQLIVRPPSSQILAL